jgi:ketosteroid isomerase-like protein
MSAMAMGRAAPEGVALTVLTHLKNGKIDEAIAGFVEQFTFQDHGLGLEFTDTARLAAFFRKTRELYPDSCLETHTIFVSGEHVIMAWTRHTTVTEPCYGGRSRKVHVSVHGASIVRTEHGKITEWADYYDGLTARRTALAAHFKAWVEL